MFLEGSDRGISNIEVQHTKSLLAHGSVVELPCSLGVQAFLFDWFIWHAVGAAWSRRKVFARSGTVDDMSEKNLIHRRLWIDSLQAAVSSSVFRWRRSVSLAKVEFERPSSLQEKNMNFYGWHGLQVDAVPQRGRGRLYAPVPKFWWRCEMQEGARSWNCYGISTSVELIMPCPQVALMDGSAKCVVRVFFIIAGCVIACGVCRRREFSDVFSIGDALRSLTISKISLDIYQEMVFAWFLSASWWHHLIHKPEDTSWWGSTWYWYMSQFSVIVRLTGRRSGTTVVFLREDDCL